LKTIYWILWPGFMVAVVATGFMIAAVNAHDLSFAGAPLVLSRLGVYTLGFLVLWALAAASSLTTCILQRSGDDINRSLFG
jgi:hypothetical protein